MATAGLAHAMVIGAEAADMLMAPPRFPQRLQAQADSPTPSPRTRAPVIHKYFFLNISASDVLVDLCPPCAPIPVHGTKLLPSHHFPDPAHSLPACHPHSNCLFSGKESI